MMLFNAASRAAMLRLAGFAFIAILSLSLSYLGLSTRIAAQKTQNLLRTFAEIYPEQPLSADLLTNAQSLELGGIAVTHYQAQSGDNILAHFISTHTLKGYSGNISLLIGIAPDNHTLLGARVLAHKETPGLGDKIEIRVSDWIESFRGQSLSTRRFKVKKDGGDFDAFTGATITPRAVTELIGKTLTDWQKYTQETSHGR